jgi:hypothetical protein
MALSLRLSHTRTHTHTHTHTQTHTTLPEKIRVTPTVHNEPHLLTSPPKQCDQSDNASLTQVLPRAGSTGIFSALINLCVNELSRSSPYAFTYSALQKGHSHRQSREHPGHRCLAHLTTSQPHSKMNTHTTQTAKAPIQKHPATKKWTRVASYFVAWYVRKRWGGGGRRRGQRRGAQ